MKNMKMNEGSFETAKLQAKTRSILATLIRGICAVAIVAAVGFTFITCGGDDDDNTGGNTGNTGGSSGKWRVKKYIYYTVTDGVPSVSYEQVNNWISYTNDKNYECTTTYEISSSGTTTTYNYHDIRNSQTYTLTLETSSRYETQSGTSTSTGNTTITYDPSTGLQKSISYSSTSTNSSGTTSTNYEITYNIQLLSDSDGVKTYRSSYQSITSNGSSVDLSSYPSYQQYTEYKIQNGRTLEQTTYNGDGTLYSTTTYTLSDNAVIKAKLGDLTTTSTTTPTSNSYTTLEVLSDSDTELVIRRKTFGNNNVLSSQTDSYYEKVK